MAHAKETLKNCLEESVLALIPVYEDGGGNACRVYTPQNEYRFPQTVNWILSCTASHYGTKPKLLRQLYGPVVSRAKTVPLPLSPELLLLPLKMREPRVPGDTSIGYLNSLQIMDIQDAEPPCRSSITFREGLTLPSFNTPATVRKRILQSEAVHREFLRRQNSQGPTGPLKPKGKSTMTSDEFFLYAIEQVLKRLNDVFSF